MTIFQKATGKVETLMARETAPAAATEDMYVDGSVSSTKGETMLIFDSLNL